MSNDGISSVLNCEMHLLLCVLLSVSLYCSVNCGSDVVELTDENFDELVTDGTWMVKVFAPWCSHCRKVRPIWEELAKEVKGEGIHIGAVDGTQHPSLMKRFETDAFPSFYHLKDGQCRDYNGPRTVDSFAEFARTGYEKVDAWPFYKAPNGLLMKSLAAVRRLPENVFEIYQWLHNVQGYSQLAILAMTLCVPVSFGLGLICLLDYFHSRVLPNRFIPPVARPHAD